MPIAIETSIGCPCIDPETSTTAMASFRHPSVRNPSTNERHCASTVSASAPRDFESAFDGRRPPHTSQRVALMRLCKVHAGQTLCVNFSRDSFLPMRCFRSRKYLTSSWGCIALAFIVFLPVLTSPMNLAYSSPACLRKAFLYKLCAREGTLSNSMAFHCLATMSFSTTLRCPRSSLSINLYCFFGVWMSGNMRQASLFAKRGPSFLSYFPPSVGAHFAARDIDTPAFASFAILFSSFLSFVSLGFLRATTSAFSCSHSIPSSSSPTTPPPLFLGSAWAAS
mmetsp:Transcript_20483/g.38519  ORF Transcript_20483/g.38519 Transcript_20483/m.38519 type:complete len:281 (-) Transcript_20483:368-1210(-)